MPPHATTPHHDARREQDADSPFRLLGEALRAVCDDPRDADADALTLQARVIYCAEYAHLHRASYADFIAAVVACLELHTTSASEALRRRLELAVRHWAALAFEDAAQDAEEHAPGADER